MEKEREGREEQETLPHSQMIPEKEMRIQSYVRSCYSFSWNMSMTRNIVALVCLYLLLCSTEKVRDHLKTYLDRCQQALRGGVGVDQELCLLCTQCFEVAIFRLIY